MHPRGRPGIGRRSTSSSQHHSDASDTPDLRPLPQSFAPLASFDQAQAIPFDKSILTIPHKKDMMTIKAIIVGAGVGGLAVALMMQLAGIEYEILERNTGKEPNKGGGIAVGPPVLRLFEQMGLLEDIEAISMPLSGVTTMDKDRRKTGRLESTDVARYGYPYRVLLRSALIELLWSRIPASNIHTGKLVVEIHQNPNGASCKCADGSTYYGDIIVGADGAESLVRERIFTALKEQNKLPEADMEPTLYEQRTIGGITPELKPEEFPILEDTHCEFRVQTAKDNAASTSSSSNLSTSSGSYGTPGINVDWYGPPPDLDRPELQELLNSSCCIAPGTVRDFIMRTPRSNMACIDTNDRIYKTWYSGRVVLLGDACHSAILDGVCLVNLLHDMEYNSPPEITKAFKKYHAKRYPTVKGTNEDSSTLEKLFHDKGFLAGVMRKMIFNTMWTLSLANDKYNNNRPQLSFLNFVEDRGTSKANRQKVSARLTRNRTYAMTM
ncbi:hypothetical protein BGW41_002605 [Actinomortierella wolfii]|nr:hypothetical protein BGW41_002605 [Actinomortierella wolfii]